MILYTNSKGEIAPYYEQEPPKPQVGPVFSIINGLLTFTADWSLHDIALSSKAKRVYPQLQLPR